MINVSSFISKNAESFFEKQIGLLTGISILDKKINGFKNGEFIIIAGRPSMGKTSLMCDIALNMAVNNKVLIFTLEMSAKSLISRMIANLAKVGYYRLVNNRLFENEHQRIDAAFKELIENRGKNIDIVESTLITPVELGNKVKDTKADCVFVDYLQLMCPHQKYESRQQEITSFCRYIRAMANSFNIPFVVLSQLNRATTYREESGYRPQLSDLRESGSIEQDADIVIFLHRPAYYKILKNPDVIDDGIAEFIIAKNRNGPIGIAKGVWDGQIMSFSGQGRNLYGEF